MSTSPAPHSSCLEDFGANFLRTSGMAQDWLMHRRHKPEQQLWQEASPGFYHISFGRRLSASIRHLPDREYPEEWRLQIHLEAGTAVRWFNSYDEARCQSWSPLFVAQRTLIEIGDSQAALAAAIYWLYKLSSLFK